MFKESQSIADYLMRMMPDFYMKKDTVDPIAARSLFDVWKEDKNKIKNNLFARPMTLSAFQIKSMQQAGLIKEIGNNIEITEKAMILLK